MGEPIIIVSTSRVREGRLEDFTAFTSRLFADIESEEPRLIAFNLFASDDGTEVVGTQVHPDAESGEFHLGVLGNRIAEAMEMIDLLHVQFFGTPGPKMAAVNDRLASLGVKVTVMPTHVAGFMRSGGA